MLFIVVLSRIFRLTSAMLFMQRWGKTAKQFMGHRDYKGINNK